MNISQNFISALETNSLADIITTPKTDLHSHAGRGGHKSYIEEWANITITPPEQPFNSIDEMNSWLNDNIKPYCYGVNGYIKRVEAAFAQATADNIKHLALSFGIPETENLGGIENFISIIDNLHKTFAPNTVFYPDIAIGYSLNELDKIDNLLDSGYFKGIDICNYGKQFSIAQLKFICRKVKSKNMKVKAHIGEFGGADDVFRYAEELELDEIQHGIAVSESLQIMNWLASHKIKLNVCPTSNVFLKACESYNNHPIRKLFDCGVIVTINTDDLLIFNSTVSEEFMKLYNCGLMTAEELNIIRENGFKTA